MVNSKNVKFREEKAPSPKRFLEPEGMTDIDLRRLSELSGFSEASLRKFDPKVAKKALCKTFFIVFCLGIFFLLVFLLAANRGTSLKKLFQAEQHSQADLNELVSYYIGKLNRCKIDKTLEACCTFIAEEPHAAERFSLQDCTVDRIIEAIEKHELDAVFMKDATSAIYNQHIEPTDAYKYSEDYDESDDKDNDDEYADPDFIQRFLEDPFALLHENEENYSPPNRDKSVRTIVEIRKMVQPVLDVTSNGFKVGTANKEITFSLNNKMKRQAHPRIQEHVGERHPPVIDRTHEIYHPPPPSEFDPNLMAANSEIYPYPPDRAEKNLQEQQFRPQHFGGYYPPEIPEELEFRHPGQFPDAHSFEGVYHQQENRGDQRFTQPRQMFNPEQERPRFHEKQDRRFQNHVNQLDPRQMTIQQTHSTEITSKVLNVNPIRNGPLVGAPQKIEKALKMVVPINMQAESTPSMTITPHEYNNLKDDREHREHESMNANARLNSEAKMGQFTPASEDVQSSQQNGMNSAYRQNLCIGTYSPPGGSPLSIIQQQVPLAYDPIPKFAQLVPISFTRPQTPYVINPQYSYYPQITANNVNTPPQVNNGGPYVLCNTMMGASNNIAGMPGVEVRQNDPHLTATEMRQNYRALTRASDMCSADQELCADERKCISQNQICDDMVDCDDGSDERYCSCRYRVGQNRICDGYYDCPNGEDELGCNGCEPDYFNCDDWSYSRRATCIPMKQRCDGISQCPTGNDEQECSVLLDFVESSIDVVKVSNNYGFLHRNYKGRWYPVCAKGEAWASEACTAQMGSSHLPPLVQMHPINYPYKGGYISADSEEGVRINDGCDENGAVHVECAPPVCGMRQITINPYRSEEVDTSAEEIVAQFRHVREVSGENATESILGDGRVVGGRACQPAAWPWVVSIYRNGAFHCGGVLITESWLLTAAHCVDKYWHYYYEVELGMLRRFSYSPMQQTRYVSDIIAHSGYNRGNLKNDLALMRLNAPVKYNRYVRPICLPTEVTAGKDYRKAPPAGTVCTAVGWGATVEHGADPDQLREVEVPVLSYCKHKEDAEGNEICAGLMQGGKDACQGDSGGPFLCRNPSISDQWYLAGIVSHGEGCARPNEPGVYTRVSLYMDWIYDHARDAKLPSRKPLHECPGYMCKSIQKCIPKKRRCDKTVDCLYGDDEIGCEKQQHRFSTLFKHAMQHMLLSDYELSRSNMGNASTATAQRDSIASGAFKMVNSTITNATANDDTSFASPAPISDPDEFISNTGAAPAAAAPDGSKLLTRNEDRNTNETVLVGSTKAGRFLCKKMLQVIPLSKKCDKVIDCQDGSDEASCTCADYLRLTHADAICDGISDCLDLSDEKDCDECGSQYYYCRLSKLCIPAAKRCDNTPDCAYNEDEWDCFALTPSYKITLDVDARPLVHAKGLLTINYRGTWRPMCGNFTGLESKLAMDVCTSLGFNDYEKYLELPVIDNKLVAITTLTDVGNDTVRIPKNDVKTNATCNGFYVHCSNRTANIGHENHEKGIEDRFNAPSELHMTPWNAALYADGVFKCTGALLSFDWILTSIHCYDGILKASQNYLAARLGAGKGYLHVHGPHEEIIPVEHRIRVADSDGVLLKLNHHINFTRYVKPLHFYKKADFPHYQGEICVATGRSANESATRVVLLRGVNFENTKMGYRSFKRISNMNSEVAESSLTAWSGCIVCDAGNGFYPAAIFNEPKGEHGFEGNATYPSVSFIKHDIFQAMERSPFIIEPPKCESFRCLLGKCIDNGKLCNGIPDCEDASDEEKLLCSTQANDCHLQGTCVCGVDEMRCKNGKCVQKSTFCNRLDDCGDGSDEPASCSCREYLNLVEPKKVCDGVRNCYDRSDEDPELCSCRPGLFKCSDSHCIPNDMVCDGVTDCKDNSDEKLCVSLKSSNESERVGEVMTRTAGVWHSGCFPKHMSSIELGGVCESLGFTGSSASYWKVSMNGTAHRPQLEKFDQFWVHNSSKSGKLLLGLRSGLNPFVTFVEDPDKCNKLFIKCI